MAEPSPPRPQGDPASFARRRRGRNLALFFVLLAVCVLFYAITVVKMSRLG